jgi:hypothetical protein
LTLRVVDHRQASELTRADAETVACAHVEGAFHACGWDMATDPSGEMFSGGWYPAYVDKCGLCPPDSPRAPSTEFLEKIARLLLDIAQSPDTSEIKQACTWLSLGWALSGREAVAVPLMDAGILDVAVGMLTEWRRKAPADWMTWRTRAGVVVGNVFVTCWSISTFTSSTLNITQLLIEKGFVAVTIEAMKAYELAGASRVADASILPVWAGLRMIDSFDLTAPEAAPVVRLLEQMPTTLQFVLDHPLSHIGEMGLVSSADCCRVLAFAFGKQEAGGAFEFSQEIVDKSIQNQLSTFSGTMADFSPALPMFFFRPIVHLCISVSG